MNIATLTGLRRAVLGAVLLATACSSAAAGSDSTGVNSGTGTGTGAGLGTGAGTGTGMGAGAAGGGGPEQQCVDLINGYRATLGLAPYARWTDQEICASTEAASDSVSGTAHGAFGGCTENAQNECPGYEGTYAAMLPTCLDMMWKEGPGSDFSAHGHYINMSNPKYTQVACGFATTAAGKIWAVQDFK